MENISPSLWITSHFQISYNKLYILNYFLIQYFAFMSFVVDHTMIIIFFCWWYSIKCFQNKSFGLVYSLFNLDSAFGIANIKTKLKSLKAGFFMLTCLSAGQHAKNKVSKNQRNLVFWLNGNKCSLKSF